MSGRQTLFLFLLLAGLGAGAARAESPLAVLAEVGPWPQVSRLIGFRGRLWFANSVKGVNHNSADLYSLDPASGALRYERHLFSQDAGRPLVHAGLLYWPSEDSRFSISWGDLLVTNGRDWGYGTIPGAQIFHTHALGLAGDRLVAATSAWRASYQLSDDLGATWQPLYEHPTPERRVSRIVQLEALGGQLFGALLSREQRGLLRLRDGQVEATAGWPHEHRVTALAAYRGWIHALIKTPSGPQLWRSDGASSETLPEPPPGGPAQDLAADDDGLWLLTRRKKGGRVWHSSDGRTWTPAHSLAGGRPASLTRYRDRVYVGGGRSDGKGLLWGPAPSGAESDQETARAPLPSKPIATAPPDWAAMADRLDESLRDPETYHDYARSLRDLVFELAQQGPPEGFFAARLAALLPDHPLSLIGGNVEIPAAKLGRWILLWGMAVAGQGPVPTALLNHPWEAPQNPSEKYYEALPAALWALGVIGQRDRATVAALIARLDRVGDPPWLQGDLVGALTAVTGQRFAYDTAAWRDWWVAEEAGWAY